MKCLSTRKYSPRGKSGGGFPEIIVEHNRPGMSMDTETRAIVAVTDYVINTMTLTAKSGRESVDMRRLREDLESRGIGHGGEGGGPYVSHFSYRDGKEIKRAGQVLKRNGKVKKYSTKMFDNQATVVVKMPDNGGYDMNIKVFRNGNLQMTGARSLDHGTRAANIALGTAGGGVHDVQVRLMNCNFYVSRRVNREAVHAVARDVYGMQSSFNPSIYPAVKIYYMINAGGQGRCPSATPCTGFGKGACCKRVTLLVFSGKSDRTTSSAIITGAVDTSQVDAAYGWFARMVVKHASAVLYAPL